MEQSFKEWASTLSKKYHEVQLETIKSVNHSMISFFIDLGKEISNSSFKEKQNFSFYGDLSKELIESTSKEILFSPENLAYIEHFYLLSMEIYKMLLAENSISLDNPEKCISVSIELSSKLSKITWSHHQVIIDKFFNQPKTAWLFINKVIDNGWSTDTLLEKIHKEFINNFQCN